jgi:hypothetical protein
MNADRLFCQRTGGTKEEKWRKNLSFSSSEVEAVTSSCCAEIREKNCADIYIYKGMCAFLVAAEHFVTPCR